MTQVTIHQAKTQLSRLIQKALNGEEIVIANRAKPVVRLEAIQSGKPERRLGFLARKLATLHGFDDAKLEAEIAEDFYRDNPEDPLLKKN